MKRYSIAACLAIGVVAALWPLQSLGQVTNSSYSVTHGYVFTVPNALPPIAFFNESVTAGAFEPAPGWDVRYNNSGVFPVVASGAAGILVAVGTDLPRPGYVDAGATAQATATVLNWGGGVYSATMTSSGSAHAAIWPDRAYAQSSVDTRIFAPALWRNGRIVWRPIIVDRVMGVASATGVRRPVRVRDPIMVDVIDPAGGTVLADSFFDVFLEVSGDLDWNDTGLTASDGSGMLDLGLKIDVPTGHVANPGSLVLDIVGGVVTQSQASGRFDSVALPTVGTLVGGTLNLPTLPGEFVLEYTLPDFGNNAEYVFMLGGGGSNEVTTIAEPIGVLILGGMLGAAAWARRRLG